MNDLSAYQEFVAAYDDAKTRGALIPGENDPLKMWRGQYAYDSFLLRQAGISPLVPSRESRMVALRAGTVPPWGVGGTATEGGEFSDA